MTVLRSRHRVRSSGSRVLLQVVVLRICHHPRAYLGGLGSGSAEWIEIGYGRSVVGITGADHDHSAWMVEKWAAKDESAFGVQALEVLDVVVDELSGYRGVRRIAEKNHEEVGVDAVSERGWLVKFLNALGHVGGSCLTVILAIVPGAPAFEVPHVNGYA